MVHMPGKDPKEWWLDLRDGLGRRTQENRSLVLRSMLMAVATKQAWVRMENFAKSGASEGKFNATCLLNTEDSNSDGKKQIDWEAILTSFQQLLKQQWEQAKNVKRKRWWNC